MKEKEYHHIGGNQSQSILTRESSLFGDQKYSTWCNTI